MILTTRTPPMTLFSVWENLPCCREKFVKRRLIKYTKWEYEALKNDCVREKTML